MNKRSTQAWHDLNKWVNCLHLNFFAWFCIKIPRLIQSEWRSKPWALKLQKTSWALVFKRHDKEFTSRRRTEESCTWGRGDGATFSNHSSSTAIVPSFVILCWLYFQMTRISISLRKGMVEFHICNVSLLCFQTIYIHVLLPYKLVTVTLMVGRLGYSCSGFHMPLNFLLLIQCSGAEWNFIWVSQYVVLSTIIVTWLFMAETGSIFS